MSGRKGFVMKKDVLKKYTGPGGDVTVPDGVTGIGESAFKDCVSLTGVILPDSLTYIDSHAFENCTSLKQINIPKGVKKVKSSAFRNCKSLTSINIPKEVFFRCFNDSYYNAFDGCLKLNDFRVEDGNPYFKAVGEALYNQQQSVLIAWPSAEGQVTIPNSVTEIGSSAFEGCTNLTQVTIPDSVTTIGRSAFWGCTSLTQVTIPNSVTKIGFRAFQGCTNLTEIVLPDGLKSLEVGTFAGCTSLKDIKLPADLTEIDFSSFAGCPHVKRMKLPKTIEKAYYYSFSDSPGCNFVAETKLLQTKDKLSQCLGGLVYVTGGEDLAYVVLFQELETWQNAVKERISKEPSLAEDVVLAMSRLLTGERQIKMDAWERAAAFVLAWQDKIKDETLQAFYDLAREKKAPVLDELENDLGVCKRIKLEGVQETAQFSENPIEQTISEKWKATPTVQELQKLVKHGVHYAGSEELCSKEVLIWLIAFPVDTQKEMNDSKKILKSIQQNLDPIAACLDRAELMEFLDTRIFSNGNPELFIPAYCRYADEGQIEKLIRQMKDWHQWYVYGSTGRKLEGCVKRNLIYSETKAAMRNCPYLHWYADIRGTDVQTLQDTVLADLGLDQDGKKYYDLGSKTVEARMGEDLTLKLYDPEAGKEVKSMPKKGADPEKYETAKKDFARLKKDIRAAVKERINLLFQRFLDGQGQKGEDWKKIYFQNPMLNQIARLLVWSQNKKTFIMTAQGTVDSAGKKYKMNSKPVKVAHPMEMNREDLERWQKYFTAHALKQPFEQVWEPVVDFSTIQADRYQGLSLLANQLRSQNKHGIYFDYSHSTSELETRFADLNLACDFTEFQRHWMEQDARVVFGKLEVKKASRAANHVLVKLDRWLASERVRKDDATVVDILGNFTLAQVTELLNLAIENHCTNCTAALLEYKNRKFPDFDPMDVFTLE